MPPSLLRLILRRVWQRPLMLEHLTEIAAVNPATTGRTSDEMLRFILRWIANALAEVFSARNIGHRGPPVKREGYPLAGVFPVTGFTRWTRAQAGHPYRNVGLAIRWWARQTKPVRSRLSWDIDRLQKP